MSCPAHVSRGRRAARIFLHPLLAHGAFALTEAGLQDLPLRQVRRLPR